MVEVLTPDLCVIGAGSAGLTVAAAARAFGASVVLIEKDRMGGDCLNTGCVPSKSLIAAAKHAHIGRTSPPFGITFATPEVDFKRVHGHIQDVIDSIAPHDSIERYQAMGATVIREAARFVDRNTVAVDGRFVRARRFVIATGSRAFVPRIPGLSQVPYLTNETIFGLKERPSHLIVIGGGPIGMELAQAYGRLGARVTVIEAKTPLAKDDPELASHALRRIAEEGVDVRTGVEVTKASKTSVGISVTLALGDEQEEVLSGSHLLVAVGRSPNTSNLGLEDAHIRFDATGVKVNRGLRTTNRKVFAIGDVVAGGMQFTHVAGYHASLVVRNALFGLPVREKRQMVPWVTFTDPEIANVGLTEPMAREKLGENYRLLRWAYFENDRARAERQTEGLVKLIVDKRGTILGCGIAGAQAGEMISLFAYAMANGMKIGSFLKFIAPYPTLNEMAKRISVEFYKDKLENPWIGRWIGLIRRLP